MICLLFINQSEENVDDLQIDFLRKFFGQAERGLLAQENVKMISFFPHPWHPSPFHLFKCDFVGTYWSDLSDFRVNTTTASRSTICEIFGFRFFLGEFLTKKNQFLDFLEGKGFFWVMSIL